MKKNQPKKEREKEKESELKPNLTREIEKAKGNTRPAFVNTHLYMPVE